MQEVTSSHFVGCRKPHVPHADVHCYPDVTKLNARAWFGTGLRSRRNERAYCSTRQAGKRGNRAAPPIHTWTSKLTPVPLSHTTTRSRWKSPILLCGVAK